MQENDDLRALSRKLNLLLLLVVGNMLFLAAMTVRHEFGLFPPAAAPAAPQGEPPAPKPHLDSPLDRLRYIYGRKLYSQYAEETLIRSFFKDMCNGFFVDVGASDWRQYSTTLYLEERLGWKGIAIDANPAYKPDYVKHRPQTKFFSFFVGDSADGEADFYLLPSLPGVASGNREHVASFAPDEASTSGIEQLRVPKITLNKLLDHEQVRTIDLLCMDIEGHELAALAGFDLQRFRPRLVCIEVDHSSKEQIEDYFVRNNYSRVVSFTEMDQHNWYFAPLQAETGMITPTATDAGE